MDDSYYNNNKKNLSQTPEGSPTKRKHRRHENMVKKQRNKGSKDRRLDTAAMVDHMRNQEPRCYDRHAGRSKSLMRGIGDNIVIPLGSACIDIEIQNIIEKVNVFIVGDSVIKYPVLIGHSFTEKPGIVITKTTDSLIFKRHCTGKQLLVCRESITIEPGQMSIVSVSSENDYSGFIYVRGSLRRIDGDDYYLMAGEYSIKNGNGCILVQNLINKSIFIAKDTLWTRAIDSSRDCLNVNVLDMSSLDSDLNDLDFLGFHVSDEGIDHVIDVLRVDVKDWISTIQSDDEEIKRIREILRDDDTKFIADVRNNYQLRGEHVYRIVENGDVQLGRNSTVNKSTGKSPSELLFSCKLINGSENILSDVLLETNDYVNGDDLMQLRSKAKEKIDEQQIKAKKDFDKHRKKGTDYNIGDLVRIERNLVDKDSIGKSKKLLPKFHGPYRILKILPNDRFLVEDTPLSRRGSKRYENIVALDKMHPWLSFKNHSTDDSGTDNDDDIPEE
ncbi:hypothetical protein ACJJTC_005710 [Scirpophaga incertulas]